MTDYEKGILVGALVAWQFISLGTCAMLCLFLGKRMSRLRADKDTRK